MNDQLGDEIDVAYANAFLMKVRGCVGAKEIGVYHAMLEVSATIR
jgi:hypothetical protein